MDTKATLTKIYDTRIIDTDGRKVFLGEDMPKCARCGRSHAVVYVVEYTDGSIKHYGSTCAAYEIGAQHPNQIAYAKKIAQMEMVMYQMLREDGVITIGQFANMSLAKTVRDTLMAKIEAK